MLAYLKIRIIDIDSSTYPNMFTCNFTVASGEEITIIDKLDLLTNEKNCDIVLPFESYLLRCEIIADCGDKYTIDIATPYGMLDTKNNSQFVVSKELISIKS